MTDLRQALVRSVAEECGPVRAVTFDPNARAFEAFSFGRYSRLYDPLEATTLEQAVAETTARWAWDRGDRFGIREIGAGDSEFYPFGKVAVDLLHVYAVRRSGRGTWHRDKPMTYKMSAEHICSIDLNVICGVPVGLVGTEKQLHEQKQSRRPAGARR